MATVRCPSCAKTIAFRGRHVACPNCGGRIHLPLPGTPAPLGEDYDASTGPDTPAILDVAVASEIYHQTYVPHHRRSSFWTGPRLVAIAGSGTVAVLLLLLSALYLFVFHTASKPAQAPQAHEPIASRLAATIPTVPAPQHGNRALFEALTAGAVPPETVAAAAAAEDERPAHPAAPAAPLAEASTAPATRPVTFRLKPVFPPKDAPHPVSDQDIDRAIRLASDFMVGQFPGKRVKGADNYDQETFAGLDALCVYSLLVAGQTTGDPRLVPNGEFMKGIIDRLKEFPMEGNKATYGRSIRAAALAVFDRPEDRAQLDADAKWLLKSSVQGAYTYSMPPAGAERSNFGWDNSNSQYGALGVWAATLAGIDVPAQYWADVQAHWADCQTFSGGWGYGRGAQSPTLSMTSAGLTMLYVTFDQLGGERPQVNAARKPTTSAGLTEIVERGLEWMDEGDHAVHYQGAHPGYTLYGMERAGLASGLKFFGNHDWYRELTEDAVHTQQKNGSWTGGDGVPAETAFHLLYLCRGRYPIFMSKLRIPDRAPAHPRDVNHLSRYVSKELERPFNWQAADLDRGWKDWMDAPVLMIDGAAAIDLQDRDIANLRAYAENGGMLFTQADNDSKAFSEWVEQDLARRLFPGRPLAPLPEDHPLYTALADLKPRPKLMAVSNGARLLLVHSPRDLSGKWTRRIGTESRPAADIGMNLFVYAAGRRDFRNRMQSPFVAPDEREAVGTIHVARIKYDGNWDPEPAAWTRAGRIFQHETSIAIDAAPVKPFGLADSQATIADLTGTDAVAFSQADADVIHDWVAAGGTLLIDADGGSRPFAESVETALLPRLLKGANLVPIPADHPLLAGGAQGMRDLMKVRLSDFAVQVYGERPPAMCIADVGKGHVIVSKLDLTTALLDCRAWGIAGYHPAWAQAFVDNLLLWSLTAQ